MKHTKQISFLLRRLSFFLIAFISVCSLHAEETEVVYGDLRFKINTETKEAGVNGLARPGYTESVQIPASFIYDNETYNVVTINWRAFASCVIGDISIPSSITSIGKEAFQRCDIKSLTIPESVTLIEDGAFSSSSLESLDLKCKITVIPGWMCDGCKNLTTITIPNTVTRIKASAFRGSGLYTLTIPGSVTVLEDWVFGGTPLVDLTIEEGLVEIQGLTFAECKNLKSITLPNTVETLSRPFSGCINLKEVILSQRLKHLCGFDGCSSLENITIPASVETIGDNAFANSGLKNLNIPSGVKNISWNAFHNTPLESITVDSRNQRYDSRNNCNAIVEKTTNKLFQGCINTTIVEGILEVGDYAFGKMPNSLTSISIPQSVTKIGNYAFANNKELTSIVLPETMQEIGQNAFEGCTGTTTIILPKYLRKMGNKAFTGIKKVKKIELPSGLGTVPVSAFEDCENLEELYIPHDVIILSDRSFWFCPKLKSIVCEAIAPPSLDLNTFYNIDSETCVVKVPQQSVADYSKAEYWSDFTHITSITTPVSSITLNAEKLTLKAGETYFLTAKVLPETATDNSITWASSSPTDVAIVPQTGMVIALTGNGAIITATANDGSGVVATCYVNMEKTATIVDGEDYAETESVDYDKVYYKRTFKNTNLQALYVPIAINVEDIPDFKVYKIGALYLFDENQNGIYYEEEDMSYLKLLSVNTGVLKPNHPYYIQASVPGDVVIPSYDNILYAAEENTIESCTVETRAIFHGNYTKQTFDYDIFALSGGNLALGKGATLPAFRWYMTVEDKGGQLMQIPSDAKIQIITDDDDMANSIDEKIAAQKQTVKTIYTVDGMQHNALQKGLNIIRYSDGTTKKYLNK